MKYIYLCGPIKDLTVQEANDWRQKAVEHLVGFTCLNPMRRNFRDCEFQSQNEIIQLDKNDIIRADIILVNATKSSWGTAMEVLFAFMKHKIIISFTNDVFEKTSPWLAYHSTHICKTMVEAINYIKEHLED